MLLPAGPKSGVPPTSRPTVFLVLRAMGWGMEALKIPPRYGARFRHALWPSVVNFKSVRPGIPVQLSRQQYLLINLFIDLLGCTWGFSREGLQTRVPLRMQPSVRLKFGLKMPQGLEWAGLEPAQSSRRMDWTTGHWRTEDSRGAGRPPAAAAGRRHAVLCGNGAPGAVQLGTPGLGLSLKGKGNTCLFRKALLCLRSYLRGLLPEAGHGGESQSKVLGAQRLRFLSSDGFPTCQD